MKLDFCNRTHGTEIAIRTGSLTGECYTYYKDGTYKLTDDEGVRVYTAFDACNVRNGQLPVPNSQSENEYLIEEFGQTALGIKGELAEGVVTWKNIYTQVR